MIVSFSVGNYLSFKEIINISFIPESIKDNEEESTFSTSYSDLRLLKGGAFIGPNSSGKSNVLKAISFMKGLVLNSFYLGPNESIEVECFKLNPNTVSLPSYFEMIFLIDDVKYRYGFEVLKSHIEKEWLYYSIRKSEKKYFERNKNQFDVSNNLLEGHRYKGQTRANSLFLSTIAQHNGNISLSISKWFQDLVIISDSDYVNCIDSTAVKYERDGIFKSYLKKLINIADLGFDDFEIITTTIDDKILKALPDEIKKQIKNSKQIQIKTLHKRFDNSGNIIENIRFDLLKEESQGTIKYFALAGPIIDCLMQGKPLIIDEMDSRLHPYLSSTIIKIFNSKKENLNNSQLIFTTQNHNFLEEKILRRDQVFFVDKNIRGETSICNVLIKKKVRNDASYKKDYDSGKYGARPNISSDQLNLFD